MQGVVIQGSTGYVNEVIDLYEGIPNVVFSTWKNEPEENIQLIKSKGIDVIQSPKPQIVGKFNVNLQALSTFTGVQYLKNKGVTEILKIRNDLKPNNIKLLLDILKGKSLSFGGFHARPFEEWHDSVTNASGIKVNRFYL